jgi:hypothetical protein
MNEPQTPKPRQTALEKIDAILDLLSVWRRTLGDLLYHLFRLKDEQDEEIKGHSRRHTEKLEKFVRGESARGVGYFIHAWLNSLYAKIPANSPDNNLTYQLETPYKEIKPAKAALTSFAAQILTDELVREAESAVKPTSGLHSMLPSKSNPKEKEWADIGPTAVEKVSAIIQKHQQLTWNYLPTIASRESRKRSGEVNVQKKSSCGSCKLS